MRVTAVEESVIRDIGHAFGYYDYGAEHGLIDAFPSREAAAAFAGCAPEIYVIGDNVTPGSIQECTLTAYAAAMAL